MKIQSPSFVEGGFIPATYTCDGEDLIPPMQFLDVLPATKSLAFVIDDPDASLPGGWDHYIVWNISPDTKEIIKGVLPAGMNGKNSWGETGYKGPCPPELHRYVFNLFALDAMLDITEGSTKKELMEAMKGHIINEARLMGKYKR